MSKELFKTIEAQGRLITELRAELEDIAKVSKKLIDHHYDEEKRHWEELSSSTDEPTYLNHIVSKWDNLRTLINK
jgi:hypothetical protein